MHEFLPHIPPPPQSVQSSTIRQALGLNSNEVFYVRWTSLGYLHTQHIPEVDLKRHMSPSSMPHLLQKKKFLLTQFILDLCRNGWVFLFVYSVVVVWFAMRCKNNDNGNCLSYLYYSKCLQQEGKLR